MSRDDMTTERLEAELRDVFAHQADSVDIRPRPFTGPTAAAHVATLEVSDDLAERRRFSRPRAFAAGVSVLATAAAIALFVANISPSATHKPVPTGSAARVLSALNKTKSQGSFVAKYSFKEVTGTPSRPASKCQAVGTAGPPDGAHTTTPAAAPACPASNEAAPAVNGTAWINVNPVSVSSTLYIAGITGPILIHADEKSVSDTSGVGPDQSTSQAALPDFVFRANSTLKTREGSVSLLTLASPFGYLAMTDDAVQGAKPVGQQKIGNTRLMMFDVFMTPAQMASINVSSDEEAQAIRKALANLKNEGYVGTNMRVGIANDGLIHYAVATATFADHGTVTLTTALSDFGCEARAALKNEPVTKACGVPVAVPPRIDSKTPTT
jgi:hypothetical protein